MGLYDDDNAAVTEGDQNNKEFWYARAYAEALDMALKQKQPEGAIKDFLKEVIKAQDEALAIYPQHAGLKKAKEKAENIQKKINPNADWASWKTGWPWDTPFVHGWVEYNWSKTAKGAGDWSTVYDQSRAADNHLGDYGAKKHYNGWSDDLKKWVDNAHTEMTTLWEESRKHR
jgi:hypothetical protein